MLVAISGSQHHDSLNFATFLDFLCSAQEFRKGKCKWINYIQSVGVVGRLVVAICLRSDALWVANPKNI